jgi:hypothetical protein
MKALKVWLIMLSLATFIHVAKGQIKTGFEFMKTYNLGKSVNTEHYEGFSMVTGDGLSLYFSSNRPGGLGDLDIYLSQRPARESEWGPAFNLTVLNSEASDHSVTLSDDGHYIYFMSEREGGFGEGDIYISYREDIYDSLGWGKPENIGSVINTPLLESCPLFNIEDGKTVLYFVSSRIGGVGQIDIYRSEFNDEINEFEEPVNLSKINTSFYDMHFEPIKGLIWSDRPGGIGKHDIWMATYDRDSLEWVDPVVLKPPINTEFNEGMPSITHDAKELYFHSDRPGGYGLHDIYVAK